MRGFTHKFVLLLSLPGAFWPQALSAQTAAAPQAHLSSAEQALRHKDLLLAESELHSAAASALLALGNLGMNEGRWEEALTAYSEASQNLAEPSEALLGVATVYLQQDKPKQAESLLRELSTTSKNPRILQLFAVSYAAQGRFGEALQEIAEARSSAPQDPELAYVGAVIAVQSGDADAANKQFSELLRLRPGAATHVLIGRTWRDYNNVRGAERELKDALRIDPRVPRANYYLGTMLLREPGRIDEAIAAFRRELEIDPDDYLTNLNAGVALLSEHKSKAALPLLSRSARVSGGSQLPFYYLGQVQFQVGDMAGAADSLTRYLNAGEREASITSNLGNAEYVLAQALRALGREQDAAAHFTRARDLKAKFHVEAQEQLQDYIAANSSLQKPNLAGIWKVSAAPLPAKEAEQERSNLVEVVARSYFNLGVILSQRQRYRAAASSLYRAATWNPTFPNVQGALGTARFKAGMYGLAIEPLRRALGDRPNDSEVSRLLALSCFKAGSYSCAVEMLQRDSGIVNDEALQYALGVSLVRVGKANRATQVFERLIQRGDASAELYSLLGDANAQQGDFDAALTDYERAVKLDPKILGAKLAAALVLIRQGNLEEAETHLRAELSTNPSETRARYHLAYVLEREGKKDDAAELLRELLTQTPAHPNARFLLGRILLDKGDTAAAIEQLEASVRLAPEEPRAHYQLGRAYQKLGRLDDAKREFDLFKQLKHSGLPSTESGQAQ